MKTIEISYNPYKMITKMLINQVDVCRNQSYEKFKDFIENEIPLQTWIEPIEYRDWAGFVNEISDPETNDEVKVIFSGRKIDFDDLKRAIADQNEDRSEETRVRYTFEHKTIRDDKILAQNIEEVVSELKSPRFRELIQQRTTEELSKKYNELDENYQTAKENLFYIVLAGGYSSGKSTLLNALIRHDILPTCEGTCTSRNCRIHHDSSLGKKVSLACYDENDKIVIEKRIFENDSDCADLFWEICPIRDENTMDKYPEVAMMELGVDLSHLYPDSVSEDTFTIVLIDTPGMDSSQSSQDGINRHAEIALQAMSMESKPMIILCVDAKSRENKNIGEFMREIINQTKEESGFNDRYLFLMNKSDASSYAANRSNRRGEVFSNAESVKAAFAAYLTDSSKWGIEGEEDELKQLAEEAARFVPRIFMTTGLVASAIQCGADAFTDEELKDPYKKYLHKKLEDFKEEICGPRIQEDFCLSRYCDIPNYRKDEIEKEFHDALEAGRDTRAAELQCGLVSVESAIKDYIARYAYPIKVRGLLDTFEDILEDVNNFNDGILADLKQMEKDLGERNRDRKEARETRKSAEEKIGVLEKTEEKIESQMDVLDGIKLDSNALRSAVSDFRADLEAEKEVTFIRWHYKISTGQKSRAEVEHEINERASNIKDAFARNLSKINKKLEEIEAMYNTQILTVFGFLKSAVKELEDSGVFQQGEYKFTDSVMWKTNFRNIDAEKLAFDMKRKVVDKEIRNEKVGNSKKREWGSSWNLFKKFGSLFMEDYKIEVRNIDGYYETNELNHNLDAYYAYVEEERINMEQMFEQILEGSKHQVQEMIKRLLKELQQFHSDIRKQEQRIEELGKSINELNKAIEENEETCRWLKDLKVKIEEE